MVIQSLELSNFYILIIFISESHLSFCLTQHSIDLANRPTYLTRWCSFINFIYFYGRTSQSRDGVLWVHLSSIYCMYIWYQPMQWQHQKFQNCLILPFLLLAGGGQVGRTEPLTGGMHPVCPLLSCHHWAPVHFFLAVEKSFCVIYWYVRREVLVSFPNWCCHKIDWIMWTLLCAELSESGR